jgi:hypothetical protein
MNDEDQELTEHLRISHMTKSSHNTREISPIMRTIILQLNILTGAVGNVSRKSSE